MCFAILYSHKGSEKKDHSCGKQGKHLKHDFCKFHTTLNPEQQPELRSLGPCRGVQPCTLRIVDAVSILETLLSASWRCAFYVSALVPGYSQAFLIICYQIAELFNLQNECCEAFDPSRKPYLMV